MVNIHLESKPMTNRQGKKTNSQKILEYLQENIGEVSNEELAREIKDIIDKYLFPGGIARYGMDLTRSTARASHAEYIGGDPNLFNLKEEAYAYINDLIEEQKDTKRDKAFHPLWG